MASPIRYLLLAFLVLFSRHVSSIYRLHQATFIPFSDPSVARYRTYIANALAKSRQTRLQIPDVVQFAILGKSWTLKNTPDSLQYIFA